MTPSEAEALAERVLPALEQIESAFAPTSYFGMSAAADRERIASDLAGLRQHAAYEQDPVAGPHPSDGTCRSCRWRECQDRTRYAAGLRRTASLYGIDACVEYG